MLRDLDMTFTGGGIHSPIRIVGEDGSSNLEPNTDVSFILDGENRIYNSGGGRACIQVDQGTTARFSAIDPNNDFSGSICVTQANDNGGAGIGALDHSNNTNEATASASITGSFYGGTTAGGNIVISSGIVVAKGGHGAGIGGGFNTYYDGIILIYGGIIRTSCVRHAAGIGSGCPTGSGVVEEYTPHSTIIALPPADIISTGAGSSSNVPVASLGLAGTSTIVYIGDPNKPLVTVRTEDYEPNANIYVDLSQNEDVATVCNLLAGDRFDINQVHFGATGATGLYQFHGFLQDSTTFFTDATSSTAGHLGSPYSAVTTTLTNGGTVVMPRVDLSFSKTEFPAAHLFEGYTPDQAQASAFRLRVEYNDSVPLTDFAVDLAQGSASPFDALSIFGPDGVTPFSSTALSAGDTLFIHCPLRPGRPASRNLDVLRITGQRHGQSIGYIRQVVTQHVIHCDSVTICETGQYTLASGTPLTQPGLYFDTLHGIVSAAGDEPVSMSCNGVTITASATTGAQRDSVLAIVLSVMPAPRDTLVAQACDSLLWQGQWRSATDTYEHVVSTDQVCDSLLLLQLTVHPSSLDTLAPVASCLSHSWQGMEVSAIGDTLLRAELTSVHGCDSILLLPLTIHDSSSVILPPEEHCYNYTWNGTLYTQLGVQTLRHLAQNQWGCDSATYLSLTLHDSASVTLPHVDACDHYDWNDYHPTTPGEYILVYRTLTLHGCDSATYLPLTLHDTSLATLHVEACDHYLWNGETLGQSGTYTAQGLTTFGCDSLCVLLLTIMPEYHYTTDLRMCENSGTVWYEGTAYHETGIYERRMRTIHGCDSIETLNLTVEPTPHPILKVSPEVVDLDNLQVHIEDKCATPCHHNWFFNGDPYGGDEAEFYYDYPIAEDSVRILLINQSLNAFCSDTAAKVIYIRKGIAWTPNVFTPDMPTNNRFSVAFEGVSQATVTIYTRQGHQVAEFDGLTGSWDGTHNGAPCPQGTYIYIARYATHTAPKNTLVKRGTITLLR